MAGKLKSELLTNEGAGVPCDAGAVPVQIALRQITVESATVREIFVPHEAEWGKNEIAYLAGQHAGSLFWSLEQSWPNGQQVPAN